MLRSILAAMATASAASRVRGVARDTAYGTVAIFALLVALVFLSLAVFYWLSATLGPAAGAAIVAGGLALLAGAIGLWAYLRRRNAGEENWMEQLGLPSVPGLTNPEDIDAIVDEARMQVKRIGPLKLTAAAFAAGFILSRLR